MSLRLESDVISTSLLGKISGVISGVSVSDNGRGNSGFSHPLGFQKQWEQLEQPTSKQQWWHDPRTFRILCRRKDFFFWLLVTLTTSSCDRAGRRLDYFAADYESSTRYELAVNLSSFKKISNIKIN